MNLEPEYESSDDEIDDEIDDEQLFMEAQRLSHELSSQNSALQQQNASLNAENEKLAASNKDLLQQVLNLGRQLQAALADDLWVAVGKGRLMRAVEIRELEQGSPSEVQRREDTEHSVRWCHPELIINGETIPEPLWSYEELAAQIAKEPLMPAQPGKFVRADPPRANPPPSRPTQNP